MVLRRPRYNVAIDFSIESRMNQPAILEKGYLRANSEPINSVHLPGIGASDISKVFSIGAKVATGS